VKKILVSLAVAFAGLAASLSAQAQFNPSNGFQTINNQCGTFFLQGSTYYNGSGVSVGSALPFCAGSMSTQSAGSVQMQPAQFTVATLPACNASSKALLLVVTDATSPTYNAALTGGGAVVVPVLCNGSAWTSH
jgi:hypothetical protein